MGTSTAPQISTPATLMAITRPPQTAASQETIPAWALALQNELQSVKVSTRPKPKPADPSHFYGDGTIYVENWLNEVATYLLYYDAPVKDQVMLAESFLKGKARALWDNIR